jgi:hypothetical protein
VTWRMLHMSLATVERIIKHEPFRFVVVDVAE